MAIHKLVDLQVTNFPTKITSACTALLANENGLVILGSHDATLCGGPPALQTRFAPGCIMFLKDGTSASTNIAANSGTTDAPVWTAWTIN